MCLFPTLGPHQFGETVQDPVADGSRCLGRYVSRPEAGAPGCQHQACHLALLAQSILNVPLHVRHYQATDDMEPMHQKQVSHHRP